MRKTKPSRIPIGWTRITRNQLKNAAGFLITRLEMPQGVLYEVWPPKPKGRLEWPSYRSALGVFHSLEDAIARVKAEGSR